MKTKRNKKIEEAMASVSLAREKILYNVLGESLADRLFFYFHGTVDFDYEEDRGGSFIECNLPTLFSALCLFIECAGDTLATVRMHAKEDVAEIRMCLHEGRELPEKEIYESALLGGMEYSREAHGISLFLSLSREPILNLFANRETITAKLDIIAKSFGIL
ncbi:MAG: hypothetical protein IKC72_00800 [Clostridia bacterium]|nr:hypothetical protein [Clostridia bacterium]